jgi:hypothetical protein
LENGSEGIRYSKFEVDIRNLLQRLCSDIDYEIMTYMNLLGERLIELYKRKLVKINHSVMELICAKPLIKREYEVMVEHILNSSGLICDLFGVKGEGVLIMEIETGYTPPSHALDPFTYNRARITSKIARYSSYSNKFALATPIYNVLRIPSIFSKSPRLRKDNEVEKLKKLCDEYYSEPPITSKLIREANLQSIYLIDIDRGSSKEIDPEEYQDLVDKMDKLID